jgi:hypothetical protein
MITETLNILFTRDLKRLRQEIESYNNEHNLWRVENDISNSAGNLCLHLIGNLNTYIGKEIGKIDYIRNRELEFSLKDIPKVELLKKIDETILIVSSSLERLTPGDLLKEYPVIVFDTPTSTEFLLVHLATHLAYHLGQINYHRRLLDK